jgi:hypothetical protein
MQSTTTSTNVTVSLDDPEIAARVRTRFVVGYDGSVKKT